ncbi:butyrophilin subfamily 2 member A2-like isoform X2 [Sparus aurata]|uniref:butyrophilin subfamily 2 member A2-like isoform X2 n=2 Tax=Sparus aurata TaxID=8175 RepID=UPI0011C1C654|nr:butyrophilin subfamily 2 member A2-like isoform X2 [Sparus aurata]
MQQMVLVFVALLCIPEVITAGDWTILPTKEIKTEEGSNVTLQCRLDPRVNLVHHGSFWFRADLSGWIHIYWPRRDDPGPQLLQYRGRTTVDHEDLRKGNLNLHICSVQLSDAGLYKCFVLTLRSSCTINMTVGERETPSTARPPLDPVTEPNHPW